MIVSETEGDRGVVYIRCDARGCAQTRSRVCVPGRPNDSDIEKPSRFPVDGWTRRTVRNVQKDYCPTHADYGTVAARIGAIAAQEEAKLVAWAGARLDGCAEHARRLVDFDARVAALRDEYEATFRRLKLAEIEGMAGYDKDVAAKMVDLAKGSRYHPLDGVATDANGESR